MSTRISREAMMSEIVKTISLRSTCERRHVGAVFSLEGRILATGYNGAPSGLPHCLDVGCQITTPGGGCTRTSHAEANAIAFAARQGIRLEGADLWCSLTPCPSCAMLLINAGIERVYCLEPYRLEDGINLLGQAGIQVHMITQQERKNGCKTQVTCTRIR